MGKIVDLSHHQGKIDFAKASKEIDLAIIRVQYGSKSVDKMYKEYVKGCKQFGIPFGHYAYARYISINDAIQEANDFMSRADQDAKFLVVDIEEMTLKDPKDIVAATQAFIDTCKRKGFKVGLYTGHHFYKPNKMDQVKADFLWIPRYGKTKPDFPCHLWQYTDKGKVDGIAGNVDLNVVNGDLTLDWFLNNIKVIKEAKEAVKGDGQHSETTGSGRVLSLTDSQWKELEKVYTQAHQNKVLFSDEWQKKTANKTLTVDEGIFLCHIILTRSI